MKSRKELGPHKFDTSTYVKIPAVNKPVDAPINLCVDHIYSCDYVGTTVVITQPAQCSICSKTPTWKDTARMFRAAGEWLTEFAENLDDEEILGETKDRVEEAFISYCKKKFILGMQSFFYNNC